MTRHTAAVPPSPDLLLLLVRHAEQRTMRTHDAELSARGRAQAQRLAERLARIPLTAVVASPLRRAIETATTVAAATALPIEVEPDLEEVRIEAEARRERYTDTAASVLEPRSDDYSTAAMGLVRLATRTRWGAVPGAEDGATFRIRVVAAVERVIARHHRGVVACVAHGGTINAILGAWAQVDRDMWFVPWHTGVSAVLVSGEERVILTVNDAAHLEAGEDLLHIVAHGIRGLPPRA
jgi:probable phosphoglycerate mutase